MLRTHTCGELNKSSIGATAELAGWVHRRRDHGGVIFVDLRDRWGLTQVKFDPATAEAVWKTADQLRSEWVVRVKGVVVARPDDMVNPKLATGAIEVVAHDLTVLSRSETPPFEIDEEKAATIGESIRLKYRFLDLRRESLQKVLRARDRIITHVREYFHRLDFVEIQTPILANSSPEGARDYLVPSRLYPGKFYALPQAPQQFKQLLMVGGLDRYFQIAPCFRDEDPRADRHPGDFYQIDLEMSFVSQEDVWQTVEPLMIELTEAHSNKQVMTRPFRRLTWQEAMDRYGSDKPDLRFESPIIDITEQVKGGGFSVFADAAKAGGVVRALRIEGGGRFSRKEIDELTELAKKHGAKGLAYIVLDSGEGGPVLRSPIIKFLGDALTAEVIKSAGAAAGDIVFFGADKLAIVRKALGAVRDDCGRRLGLKDPGLAAWVWVIDFPMYELNEETGKVDFSHNPFSMPQGGIEALRTSDPLDILAYQYDLVLNGYEISSGAIRNHEPETMYEAFRIAGYTREQVDRKFGHMIRAFNFGAPPHGGIAPGLDRLLMVLLDRDSIRDIYAFPKDGQARDVMLDAPSEVDEKQLRELGIKIDKK